MFKIQMIDVISFLILILVISFSIVFKFFIKGKLKDIEGDSDIYVTKDEEEYIGEF